MNGKDVIKLRQDLGDLSQEQLAEILDLSGKTVLRWEMTKDAEIKRNTAGLSRLHQLSDAMEHPVLKDTLFELLKDRIFGPKMVNVLLPILYVVSKGEVGLAMGKLLRDKLDLIITKS